MSNVFQEQEYRFAIRCRDKSLLVSCQTSNSIVLAKGNGEVIAEVIKTGLDKPQAMTFDEQNNELYVVDRNGGCVMVYNKEYDHMRTIGKGQLKEPVGITLMDNVVCVADNENHRIAFFEKEGCDEPQFISGFGSGRGDLFCPCGIASFKDLLIVAEWGNGRIQVFRKNKSILVIEGCPHAHSVAVRPDGTVYYAMHSKRQIGSFKIEYDYSGLDEPRFIISDKVIDINEAPTSLFWDETRLGVVTARKIMFIAV